VSFVEHGFDSATALGVHTVGRLIPDFGFDLFEESGRDAVGKAVGDKLDNTGFVTVRKEATVPAFMVAGNRFSGGLLAENLFSGSPERLLGSTGKRVNAW
jgi:hypothetical protein